MKTHNVWFKHIWRRVYSNNDHYAFFISGPTGSGKSMFALAVAELLSPNFTAKNVVFDVEGFFQLIESGTLQTGDVIVFDEAGIGMSSKEHATLENKIMSKYLQAIRTRHLVVIYTAPQLRNADKNLLSLCHGLVEMTGRKDRERQRAAAKVYGAQYHEVPTGKDPWTRKFFVIKRRSIINPEFFWKLKIGLVWMKLPSRKLRKEYEKMRIEYEQSLSKESMEQLKRSKQKEEAALSVKGASPEQIEKIAMEVWSDRAYYMDDRKFILENVQNKFNCSLATAKRIKAKVAEIANKENYVHMWR